MASSFNPFHIFPHTLLIAIAIFSSKTEAFSYITTTSARHECLIKYQKARLVVAVSESNSSIDDNPTGEKKKKDNKAMAFLRKIGKVGRSTDQDFINAMGVDEGPAGKSSSTISNIKKSKLAYNECTKSGIIDDMSETFPFTSSGTQWSGVTDKVMGGVSSGSLSRELFGDDETQQQKDANVLRGSVSLKNNGGFVAMATNLALDPAATTGFVDASDWDGVELDVSCDGDVGGESFNVHLKNASCERRFSSYRGTFTIEKGKWQTVRLPWSDFTGHGPGTEESFDVTTLRRLSILAIGKEMDVSLAVSGVRFYSVF